MHLWYGVSLAEYRCWAKYSLKRNGMLTSKYLLYPIHFVECHCDYHKHSYLVPDKDYIVLLFADTRQTTILWLFHFTQIIWLFLELCLLICLCYFSFLFSLPTIHMSSILFPLAVSSTHCGNGQKTKEERQIEKPPQSETMEWTY